MLLRQVLLLIYLLGSAWGSGAQAVYEVDKSIVSISSDAPNEFINASSQKLKGVISTDNKHFVFKVDIATFEGFNSPLQREHFHENYMETFRYPDIIFSGKIIEDINLQKDGTYTIRAKGKLTVHGVGIDRIIYTVVSVAGNKVEIESKFNVALADHNIKIPRVVNDKLATEIHIVVQATMMRKEI